ncbi:MAG: hypothetical protein V1822_03930 [Candidatus Micrarchaeota archaeon]
MDLYLALSTAVALVFIAHGILRGRGGARADFDEVPRQVAHALVGLAVIGVALLAGFGAAKLAVAAGLVLGIFLAGMKAEKIKLPLVDLILKYFERPGVFAGYGAIAYFAGMLFALSYFPQDVSLYVLYLLAVCDAAATVFGKRHGKFKLLHNRSKSFEGFLAFLIFALPVVLLGKSAIVPVVVAAAILETIDIGIDDNVLVPLAGFAYGLI